MKNDEDFGKKKKQIAESMNIKRTNKRTYVNVNAKVNINAVGVHIHDVNEPRLDV